MKILEKQLEKTEKIKEKQFEKEKNIENYRNFAVKSMINKEKVQEALCVITKSPESRVAQDRLKQYSFLKREEILS